MTTSSIKCPLCNYYLDACKCSEITFRQAVQGKDQRIAELETEVNRLKTDLERALLLYQKAAADRDRLLEAAYENHIPQMDP